MQFRPLGTTGVSVSVLCLGTMTFGEQNTESESFALMDQAQREFGWKLDFGSIARIWRGGCIIRARFLQRIADAYGRERRLPNLLLDPYFRRKVRAAQTGWRKVVALAAQSGVASPARIM